MKYLCLAYYDEKKFETLTAAEMAAIGRDCGPLDEDLQRSGHLLEVGSLAATKDSGEPAAAATARSPSPTVRMPRPRSSSGATS